MTDLDRFRKDDPFLLQCPPSDLKIASEFLTTWLPFLSRDLCQSCTQILSNQIRSLDPEPSHSDKTGRPATPTNINSHENCCDDNCDYYSTTTSWKDGDEDGDEMNSLGSWKDGANEWSEPVSENPSSGILGELLSIETPNHRMSWADMAQEDELVEEEEQKELNKQMVNTRTSTGEIKISKVVEKPKLSMEQREHIRFMNVKRKKDFICLERSKERLLMFLRDWNSILVSSVR